MNEEELKKEIDKLRFGCGAELREDYCGKDIWICHNCMFKLLPLKAELKGRLEQKKEELEFLSKVVENSLINFTFIGNSKQDKEYIIHSLLNVIKIKLKQLQKEIGEIDYN